MKPVTSNGSSQGTMTSERANLRSGNFRLNSSASPKPMRNWKSSDSTVNERPDQGALRDRLSRVTL